MCRRIIIDCEWDDDHPEDAAGVFYHVENFDMLNPNFRQKLMELFTDRFVGEVRIAVEALPR